MDKSDFVKHAPFYYALAILEFMKGTDGRQVYQEQITSRYPVRFGGPSFLHIPAVFKIAIAWAVEKDLIVKVDDYFGPTTFKISERYLQNWQHIAQDHSFPFFKYESQNEKRKTEWLEHALKNINEQYLQLGITDVDFIENNDIDDKWKPLSIDKSDDDVTKIQISLNEALENIRINNEYNISNLDEREYVVDNISAVRKRFENESFISYEYIRKRALEPLGALAKRFGKASLGILAEAAKATLKTWLQKKGITFLDDLDF